MLRSIATYLQLNFLLFLTMTLVTLSPNEGFGVRKTLSQVSVIHCCLRRNILNETK